MAVKPFSEQLREAIEKSGTSRYALARHVGISESSLSRFMSGERGLTLASLDKLAGALGLEIIIGVQQVPRVSPKGRKPAKGNTVVSKTTTPKAAKKSILQKTADGFARDASENHFPSRRGVWDCDGFLCLYNNNPYANFPDLRDRETAEFRKRLKAEGLKELAYGTYPPEGEEDAGYTYALLIEAGEDRIEWVCDTMDEILRESRAIMDRAKTSDAS